jgi:DNA-binding Lrp family transcriptional regulator
MSRAEQTYESAGECAQCFMPRDDCECPTAEERARVRALERAGIIKGYHAELSPEALGYSVSVFALVGLNSQAETDLKAFEELVAKWDEVRECHMLAGEADFLLKIVAETWDEYQKFLTTRLTSAPNVSHVKSMMVFRTAKQLPGVPISVE